MMKHKLAEFLLGGKRIYWKRFTLRFMPLRWYFGPGITLGYFALNLGPFQLFIDIYDLATKLLGMNDEQAD